MIELKDDDIQYYDYEPDEIPGATNKRFVRVNSDCLKDFFKQAKKKDSSYVTYLGDIKDLTDKDGNFLLKSISVLLKSARYQIFDNYETIVKEEFCSRLANELKVPTVYNKVVKHGYDVLSMSIDFLKSNEVIIEMKDCASAIPPNAPFQEWEEEIEKQLTEEVGDGPRGKRIKDKIINEFVPIFLIKQYVLQDLDFAPKNIAFIRNNETAEYSLAPLFDNEFALNGNVIESLYISHSLHDIIYILEKYPDSLYRFMYALDKFFDKNHNLKDDVIKKFATESTDDIYTSDVLINLVSKNLRLLSAGFDHVLYGRDDKYLPKELEIVYKTSDREKQTN